MKNQDYPWMKRIYTFLLAILFLTAGAGSVFAFDSSSTSFQILAGDIDTGGGASSSASFINQNALGQTGSGFSTSTSYNDYSGILHWLFPASGTPVVVQLNYRWRNDDGGETSATYAKATDTAITSGVFVGDRIRLRILLSNTGTGPATNYNYRLEHASNANSCTTWTTVPDSTSSEPWQIGGASNVADDIATTDSEGITNPGGKTFNAGKVRTANNSTGNITITQTQFSEIEYSIKSNIYTTAGTEYCFRVTNAGSTANFTYTVTPRITLSGSQGGGGHAGGESSGAGTPVGGGGTGGGAGAGGEGSGGGTPTGGGGSGGGSGDSGYLFMRSNLASVGSLNIDVLGFFKSLFNLIF